MEETCLRCGEQFTKSMKFSIFEQDAMVNKCLVYKITQITGEEIVFNNDKKFLCLMCRMLLVQIYTLEDDFATSFRTKEKLLADENELDQKDYRGTEFDNESSEVEFAAAFDQDHELKPDSLVDSNIGGITKKENFVEIPSKLKNCEGIDANGNEYSKEFEKKGDHSELKLKPVKTKNLEEKPFECRECQKKFKHKWSLREHENVHKIDGPHKCKNCLKSFANSRYLIEHERIHTGERPFQCKECSSAFTHYGSLHYHLKTHIKEKSFLCQICSKTFLTSRNLKDHQIIHTGEKPYKCPYCPKTFSRRPKDHIRIHTGEKPYQCDKCEKSFAKSWNLKQHVRDHHK